MVDYKKLYIDLFNQVSKAIDILTNIQNETNDEFIKSDPPPEEVIEVIDRITSPHSQKAHIKIKILKIAKGTQIKKSGRVKSARFKFLILKLRKTFCDTHYDDTCKHCDK